MSVAELVEIPVPAGSPRVVVLKDDTPFTSSAKPILRLMYAFIIAYSCAVSYLTGCPWWSMLAFYAVEYVIFFLWHAQAHHRLPWLPFNEACYRKHKEHHWTIYPPKHFFGVPGSQVAKQTVGMIEYLKAKGARTQ